MAIWGVNGMPQHRTSSFQFNVDGRVARGGRIRRKPRLQHLTESNVWRTRWQHWASQNLQRYAEGSSSRCTRASSGCASDGMSSSVLRTSSIRWRRNEWWSNRHWRVALACLSRLRADMARNPDPPPIVVGLAPTQPGVIQATDPSAEIWQLRARLAEVELERDVETKPFPSCCVPSRIRLRFGLHGQRIGEATNPSPSSRRRRTQRLRALPWSWDSDTINGRAECGPRSGVSRDSCGI